MSIQVVQISVGGRDDAGQSLADLLVDRGYALNTRCGQRSLCRGCMVDLLAGRLVDADGNTIHAGGQVRACRMYVPSGGVVEIGISPQALATRARQVAETFIIDAPMVLDPELPVTTGKHIGFAVDIGTTTVVVMLVDLTTGVVLARAGGYNAQIQFGDNVITRIGAGADPAIRRHMRAALVAETIMPLLAEACLSAGCVAASLAGGTIAGNTTMLHILAGEDPSPLGVAPFRAVFLESRVYTVAFLDLDMPGLDPGALVRFLPCLSAYLGADIAAGIHATGMAYDTAPVMLVDLGTNGEVVLATGGRFFGCASAAGPAFEGAGLGAGARAQSGAISRIELSSDPWCVGIATIDGAAPTGICGSAYIDFLAHARAHGLLQSNGRFDPGVWGQLPATMRGDDGEGGLILSVYGEDNRGISEADIANLLQAKAAIGAGIELLLAAAGITPGEVAKVYLAGGFGMHVNVANAIAIGLLPGFDASRVAVSGNTALAGAMLAMLDRSALAAMDSMSKQVEVLELNLNPGFEDCYIDHLALP